jgi:hypothetical protein
VAAAAAWIVKAAMNSTPRWANTLFRIFVSINLVELDTVEARFEAIVLNK